MLSQEQCGFVRILKRGNFYCYRGIFRSFLKGFGMRQMVSVRTRPVKRAGENVERSNAALRISQVAQELSISTRSVWNLVHSRELRTFYPLPNSPRIAREELNGFITRKMNEANALHPAPNA